MTSLELDQEEMTLGGCIPSLPGAVAVELPGVEFLLISPTVPSPAYFDQLPQFRRLVSAYLALTASQSQFNRIQVT